jgi:hypothetical protein
VKPLLKGDIFSRSAGVEQPMAIDPSQQASRALAMP